MEMFYVKNNISAVGRLDLEPDGVMCIWTELRVNNDLKFVYETFCRHTVLQSSCHV